VAALRLASTVAVGWRKVPGRLDRRCTFKVLRRPDDGGGCWHCLFRFRPPSGRAIRVTAIARSDEEVFILTGERAGHYGCNPPGLRHGQTLTEDTTVLVHYHGQPDDVLRAEVVDLAEV